MSEKPARTPPRLLQVLRTARITPHLQRVTLGGESLKGFPLHSHGMHIKIFVPRAHQSQPQLPQLTAQGIVWPPAHERPITRTYSVRQYRAEANELDVEFVMHDCGDYASDTISPAARWAKNAKPGDWLGIAGPGGPEPLLAPADWQILAGDLTALPAIAALLETLPDSARGFAFIESDEAADQIELAHPAGIIVRWLVRATDGSDVLLDAVKRIAPPLDTTSIAAFIAGENTAVVSIRNYLRATYGLNKRNLYAVPYWRRGQDEETYHQERHRIMDEVY
ncbi:MAG TPA: siderophore-interacting protein [Cellvibrio sp.]|nr:siderophore-interacting protein [Cellvibrio sp.]